MSTSRPLTHDERRAAEAAFLGRDFNASWSKSALAVYQGILKARGDAPDAVDAEGGEGADAVAGRAFAGPPDDHATDAPDAARPPASSDVARQPALSDADGERGDADAPGGYMISRQEAIDAGALVDVTHKAEQVGFRLAVALTRGLWEQSIMGGPNPDPLERDLRIRDMLLAVRLRLAGLETPRPWVDVPVLFPSMTDDEPSGVFSVYALFHTDPDASGCLTLIHPDELSAIRPFSRSETDDEPSSGDLP